MALTAHDLLMDADLFKRAYPDWPHAGRRPLPARLDDLRRDCASAGITAESPADLGPEGERLAREERWS